MPSSRPDGSTTPAPPHQERDWISAALAVILAVAPWLPAGPVHLGWAPRGYVDLVLPALLLLWILANIPRRVHPAHAVPMRTWPWDLVAAAVAGSAVHGLMADGLVTSPVFPRLLWDAIGDLFRPMNQATHPFYSLRVAVTFLEGWLVFRLVLSLCRVAPDPGRRARAAMTGWLIGLACVAAFALVQYGTQFNLHSYWVRANPSLVRTHATLDDPNALGAYLVLGLGLLAGLLRLGDRRHVGWFAALFALAASALVTTMSRSALGAAVVAPMSVLAFGPAPTTRWHGWLRACARATMITVLVVVSASVVLRAFTAADRHTNPDNPVDMVIKTFDPRESNGWVLRGRLPWWRAGIAMVREHPIVGVGLGRYPRLMERYGGGPMRENTHNLFLQMFAETGVIGFAAFVLLCATICTTLGRAAAVDAPPARRAIALGGLIGVVGFLLTLLTGHPLLVPSGQILWASFVALAVTASASPSLVPTTTAAASDERGPRATTRRRLLPLALLGVAAIAPVAGAAWQVAPPFGGPWGYHWGLHGEERATDGSRYRWTSRHALLDLRVPDDATTLTVVVTTVLPVRNGAPTVARLSAGATAHTIELSNDEPQMVRFPLAAGTQRRILLDVRVAPTFVPSALDPTSRDGRVLGIQLRQPVFSVDAAGRP